MNKESFTTIKKNVEKEIDKIKGSRFIGRLYAVNSKEEAESELERVRKQFYNATHNCFAYITGIYNSVISRYSDDGEPSGTAGRPIFNTLEASEMTNLLLVVTRYYGGTKLGTGGLAKAYSEAAKAVIEFSEKKIVEITESLNFIYHYDHTNLVMNIISKYGCNITNEIYGNDVAVTISINKGLSQDFEKEIFDRSNGSIKVEK